MSKNKAKKSYFEEGFSGEKCARLLYAHRRAMRRNLLKAPATEYFVINIVKDVLAGKAPLYNSFKMLSDKDILFADICLPENNQQKILFKKEIYKSFLRRKLSILRNARQERYAFNEVADSVPDLAFKRARSALVHRQIIEEMLDLIKRDQFLNLKDEVLLFYAEQIKKSVEGKDRSLDFLKRLIAADAGVKENERKLLLGYQDYVGYAVRKILNLRSIDFLPPFVEDCRQEGFFGLMSAAQSHDPKKSSFANHAFIHIRQKVNKFLEDHLNIVRVPAYFHGHSNHLSKIIKKLSRAFGREPTLDELACEFIKDPPYRFSSKNVGKTKRHIEKLQETGKRILSLDQPLGPETEISLGDTIKDSQSVPIADIDRRTEVLGLLGKALDTLDDRERQILLMRFKVAHGHDDGQACEKLHTYTEIGAFFNMRASSIYKIERKALESLKPFAKQNEKIYHGLNF